MSDTTLNAALGADATTYAQAPAALPSPGSQLSDARLHHGLTIEQVASQLNLAPRQVIALENDDFAALPGMVIVRGFVRAYAKMLRIDPLPMMAQLGDQKAPVSTVPMRHALSASFSESHLPLMTSPWMRGKGVRLAVAAVALLILVFASFALGWWPETLTRKVGELKLGSLPVKGAVSSTGAVMNSSTTSIRTLSPVITVPPAATASPAEMVPAPVAASPVTAPVVAAVLPEVVAPAVVAPTSAADTLVLKVRADSWIEIRQENNTLLLSKLVKAGSTETFTLREPVTLTVGNLAGVDASLRGTALDLSSGASGNVARLRLK